MTRIFYIFLILFTIIGCSTTRILDSLGGSYKTDIDQINIKIERLKPYSDSLNIVRDLTTDAWAKNPWIYATYYSGYRETLGLKTSKKIQLRYQDMVIVTPFVELRKSFDLGGIHQEHLFKVELFDYEFCERFYSSDASEAKRAQRELQDKLLKCVYVVEKVGEIKFKYQGMKELCTDTHHDRFSLMKALISLGATKSYSN